jgi:hypothetical protein
MERSYVMTEIQGLIQIKQKIFWKLDHAFLFV